MYEEIWDPYDWRKQFQSEIYPFVYYLFILYMLESTTIYDTSFHYASSLCHSSLFPTVEIYPLVPFGELLP